MNKMKERAIFHIGRGGRFNNCGYKTFLGCYTTGELERRLSDSHNLMERNRDNKGRFCKPYFVDGSGNWVADKGDKVYDLDGDYNRYIVVDFEDLTIEEWALIIEAECYLPIELTQTIDKPSFKELIWGVKDWRLGFDEIINNNGWDKSEFVEESDEE